MRISRSIIICLFLGGLSLTAQSKAPLGESEIKGSKKIEFINRSLRKASDDIIQENTEIGRKLAETLAKENTATVDGVKIQRILPGEDGKLGADILFLSESQSFDHVNSIARIIASYVEKSFQYKVGNAETLAQYILYYNATHRKDSKFFTKKYTEGVIAATSSDKLGIDTVYKNWPGKTQIIIPIEGNILKDSGKDLTTDELEKDVNKTVKDKEKDPATKQKMEDEAKKMDKLQTDKLKDEKKVLQDKKQEVANEQKQLQDKKDALKKQESETVASINELKKDPVKNKAEIEKKTEEIKKIEQEKKDTDKKSEAVEAKKEELSKKEEQIAKKEEARTGGDTAKKDDTVQKVEAKVEELKSELAQTKEELKKKEEQSDNVVNNKILFMKFIKYDTDGHYSNELWAIDPAKDDALYKSSYNNICSKEFKEIANQGVLVLGYDGEKVETRKHKLVLLDPDKLGVKKTSESADIFWRTPMINREDKIYVIEKVKDKYHVSRFKSDLTFEKRTEEPVEENSELTFFGDKIYVTGKPKEGDKTTIKVFKKEDLSLLKTIAP
ncbi:P83/100 family protein [Leptospira terpstrae]|uniref:P83/100 family protein n=1 Tax=Leptospira terpstrae TaxID=293075 RepID=UPI003D04BF49